MLQWLWPKENITAGEMNAGMRALLLDGVFAQVMLVLSTGAFLVAFALLLGASNTVIGLLAAVGPVAQILQIPAIFLVERIRLRKATVITAVLISRFSLMAVAIIPWFIPRHLAIPVFLVLLMMHFGFGAVGGCAFNSWFRDFVPSERLAAFLARRMAYATFVGALLSFAAGYGVDLYTQYTGAAIGAYSVLFLAGAISGLLSVYYLCRTPEPAMPEGQVHGMAALIMEPLRDTHYRSLLIFLGSWSFAVNFAGPFFAVYLITYLGMSMTWVLGLSVLSQMFNVLFFGVWGRLSERFSNKSVLMFSVPLFFLSFLIWPFTTMPEKHFLTIPLLIIIHILSGISTAGVALCSGNLAFKSAPYGRAASYLAVNALISGTAATISPILAGFAADWFAPQQMRLTLSWIQGNQTELELPTLVFRGLDFIFVIAFFLGIYSVHRLLAIKEEGEVSEKVLRQAFLAEMRRMVRQVSTVAGMRQLLSVPFPAVAPARRR
jgi:MFS family permease